MENCCTNNLKDLLISKHLDILSIPCIYWNGEFYKNLNILENHKSIYNIQSLDPQLKLYKLFV